MIGRKLRVHEGRTYEGRAAFTVLVKVAFWAHSVCQLQLAKGAI